MENFKDYADYYDLLYQDKDYDREVKYVMNLIDKFQGDSYSILDLGCGTGRHDFLLAENGYSVTGVDVSVDMIDIAKNDLRSNEVEFIIGDARDVRTHKKYDVVLALFHVLSYQNTNKDIASFFETVKYHMKDESIFIFDFWHGPGVLSDPPHVRIKDLENEHYKGIRIANPEIHPNQNIVDVNYRILVNEKLTGTSYEILERHKMRYFFQPELNHYLERLGFKLNDSFEWLSFNKPELKTWNSVNIVSML